MEKESSNEKSEVKNGQSQDATGAAYFMMSMGLVTWLLIIGIVCFTEMVPYKREKQIHYLQENYTFLKSPQDTFTSMFKDNERKVVFLNQSKTPLYKMESLERKDLAILYAAEVESKVGKQEWLQKAYRSYVLTESELKRLKDLESVYDEKQRAQRLNLGNRLEAQQESRPKPLNSVQEVLEERDLLAKL